MYHMQPQRCHLALFFQARSHPYQPNAVCFWLWQSFPCSKPARCLLFPLELSRQ